MKHGQKRARRSMMANLTSVGIADTLKVLDKLLAERGWLEQALKGDGSVKSMATFGAVHKAATVMAKLGFPVSSVTRVVVWSENPQGEIRTEVEARISKRTIRWDWPILKAEDKPAPKAKPKAKPEAKVEAAPAKPKREGDCEGCHEDNAKFLVERKGENIARFCGACHDKAKADATTFVEACTL